MAALLFLVFSRELPRVLPAILEITDDSFSGLVLASLLPQDWLCLPAAPGVRDSISLRSWRLIAGFSKGDDHSGVGCGKSLYHKYLREPSSRLCRQDSFFLPRLGSFRVVALAAA